MCVTIIAINNAYVAHAKILIDFVCRPLVSMMADLSGLLYYLHSLSFLFTFNGHLNKTATTSSMDMKRDAAVKGAT